MSSRVTRKGAPAAPKGLTAAIADKARGRRGVQRALAEIDAHAPPMRRNDLAPFLKTVMMPTANLKPAARQVRRRDAAQTACLRASVDRFGICRPILIAADGTIVEGHGIWEVAQQRGVPELSCIIVDHLTANEQRLLRIALNRTAETGAWDVGAPQVEFKELTVLGEDLVVTGFEMAEVDAVLLEDEDAPDPYEAEPRPPPSSVSTSQLGDVWILGEHRLIQGDAREAAVYARLLAHGENRRARPDRRALQRAERRSCHRQRRPPRVRDGERRDEPRAVQGVQSRLDVGRDCPSRRGRPARNLHRLALGGDRARRRTQPRPRAAEHRGLGQDKWRSRQPGALAARAAAGVQEGRGLPRQQYRSAATAAGVRICGPIPAPRAWDRTPATGSPSHPTVKPRALLEDALLDVTNRGDIVIDGFAGSGSTFLAAEAVGRRCRAIEIDGPYCDLIIRRWEAASGREAVLKATGETYAELAARRPPLDERAEDAHGHVERAVSVVTDRDREGNLGERDHDRE